MTNENHPITPSLELLKHWEEQHFDEGENYDVMLIQAYQAGADQELEACCEWLNCELGTGWGHGTKLRSARRPKSPSLKEQALEQLKSLEVAFLVTHGGDAKTENIRRALEALPND